MLIKINPKSQCTYINQVTNEKFSQWKDWTVLTQEEEQKVNLGVPTKIYLMLDKDLKGFSEEQILDDFNLTKQKLADLNIDSYVADRSPHGYHVFVPFNNLEDKDEKLQKKIREIYIKKLDCDLAKSSMNGVISLPERPHFKTGIVYPVLEVKEGINELNSEIVEQAKRELYSQSQEVLVKDNSLVDVDFKDYHETDLFFKHVENNVIPEGTERNNVILPNIAIGLTKEGLSTSEIDKIMKPIIQNNFPGKTYSEFIGWLRKAQKGEIQTYNQTQINNWMKKYTQIKEDIYDLTPISVTEEVIVEEKIIEEDNDQDTFMTGYELETLDIPIKQDVAEKLIASEGITIIAGKSGSFKSLTSYYVSECISRGLPIYDRINTLKSPVLYIEEENGKSTSIERSNSIKRGYNLLGDKENKIFWSLRKGLNLNNPISVKYIERKIKKHNIRVLFFDTIKRCIDIDDNKAEEVNRLYNNVFKPWCVKYGVAIVLLMHLRKGNGKFESTDVLDELKASGEWRNIADNIIIIEKNKNNPSQFTLSVKKTRDSIEPEPLSIQIITEFRRNENVKRDIPYQTRFKILEGSMANITSELRCAELIKEWISENNIDTFKTGKVLEFIKIKGYNKNHLNEALNILLAKKIIIKLKQGIYQKTKKTISIEDFEEVEVREKKEVVEESEGEPQNEI